MTDVSEELEIEVGSGNVFTDLGLDDDHDLKLKAMVAGEINSIIHHQLDQRQAAKIFGIPLSKVSALQNGNLHEFSLENLYELIGKDSDHIIHLSYESLYISMKS